MLLAINNEIHRKKKERRRNSSTTVHSYVCISLYNEIYKNLRLEPDAHISNMRSKNTNSKKEE
jgi:hypothetical protein